jgi:protein-S-isoprenylcysteine O-methyltransferase Ste14
MTFGIIFITVSVLWLGSEIILARMKRAQPSDANLDRSSLRVLWMTILPSVTVGVLLGIQRVGHFRGHHWMIPVAGMLFILCGLFVRWVAILSLKGQFTVDVSIEKDYRMVREGIYRFIRHPAYAGSLLSFFGLGLVFSNWISLLVISIPITAAFIHRIRVEEKALLAFFGEPYAHYCAVTKRLIPKIY